MNTPPTTTNPKRLVLDVGAQRLDLEQPDGNILSYPVSTSKYGLGTQEGSFRTPTGRFRIHAKFGGNAPAWMCFQGREPTGVIATPGGDEDLILSRILWLEGLDPENSNTRDRYIYIHGTNQEELIGTPASHGCVRLRNDQMIELFDLVEEGTPLLIKS
ncbi:MAG: L,D-transpeptidase [Verrucomicrobia bacterium]|nr:L,D-transpeptidase [Verrucomicrobiota bacterium]